MKTDFWEKYYEKPLEKIPWQNVQADWFKELIDNKTITGFSSLDLGCGTGQKSIYLAKHGFRKVVGVDISKRAIEFAKQAAKRESVECKFIHADATKWEFISNNQTFDFILDWANLHGIPADSRKEYIEGIDQHSHRGTLLLIRAFSSKDSKLEHLDVEENGEVMRLYMFTKESLIALFPNFRVIKTNQSDLPKPIKEGVFFEEVLLVKS